MGLEKCVTEKKHGAATILIILVKNKNGKKQFADTINLAYTNKES